MMNQPWQGHPCLILRAWCSFPFSCARACALFAALECFLLFMNVSCGQAVSGINAPATSSSVNQISSRNHVSSHGYWRLVSMTFTTEITYVQAQTILSKAGMSVYPMVNPPCGDLRAMGAPIPVSSVSSPTPAPTPMSPEELQAFFEQSHRLLVQTDSWEKLNQVATLQDVASVDPVPLPKSCPAQAPV